MITFNPNTIIKSADINANFAELKEQTDKVPAVAGLYVYFNNGTGSRSTTTSATYSEIPGATGDTSYTAAQDIRIIFTTCIMFDQTGGVCYWSLSTDGSTTVDPIGYGDYVNSGGGWTVQTRQNVVDLSAGQTITPTILYRTSTGTVTITNSSGDSVYRPTITGVILPR